MVLHSLPPAGSSNEVTPPDHAPVQISRVNQHTYSDAWLLAGLAGGGHTLMLVSGAGLLLRTPWGWRLAAGAQLLAGISQVILAVVGVIAGLALFAVAALLAAISSVGFWYVTRPPRQSGFRFARDALNLALPTYQ
jgi:hypothetical protein